MKERKMRYGHRAHLLVLLLFLSLNGSIVAEDRNQTGGFLNGRGWKQLSEVTKATYLWGLSEGSEFIKNNTDLLPKTLNFKETAEALDEFFAQPINTNIPVPVAVTYVKRKVAGGSEAELRDLESKMRRQAQSAAH